jgi:2-C-methyl-D-erythritol 4-phosphate cytidylyltransferase
MDGCPVAAVICAAGSSSRMGGIKKEFQRLNPSYPLTVLDSAVSAFAAVPSVGIIVIAVNENREDDARKALSPEHLCAQRPEVLFVNGGKSRRASVFNALRALLPYNPCYVLIHDGARPWISPILIEKLIEEVKKNHAVIPLLSITETPKECDSALDERVTLEKAVFIKTHLKRANTGVAQTPQAFKFPEILRAHEKAAEAGDEDFTDDAEIWGRFCGPVAVILGSPENRKITFPEDFG